MKIRTNIRNIGVLAAVSCLLGLSPVLFAQEHHHGDAKQAADTGANPGANPLIEEMVKLDAAFHEIVSGVALDDAARVRKAIESMHGAMEKTHEGVHSGNVKIPKNADRVEDFVRQDKQFHTGLEQLAAAAGKNDRDGMLRITRQLLGECVQCHRDFRNR